MGERSFFAELKRRNVLRAATLYAAGAWLIVQVVTQVGPVFNLPAETQRWIIVAAAIGFPFAMALSWFYELTPEGFKRDGDIAPETSIAPQTGKRLDRAIIVVLSLAVVLLLAHILVPRRDSQVPDRSIAVLPFENLSDDKANAYFAVGIQDEILTRLSKIGALKVVSRTSTQHYASSPDNLPAIARQLGVATILEGSVQKSGDKVHINVQLIQAATDQHLWAESYDRKLDDVFGVEGEVAQTIAQTLQAKLTGAEVAQVTARPTDNPAAYDAYLHGLAADRSVFGSMSQLQAASAAYARAVQLDPKFASAWALGSIADGLLWFQAFDRSPARLEAARHGADMAMQLAPESPEAWLAKGYFLYHTRDYDGARVAFAEADRRLPNNPRILAAQAYLERRSGHYDQTVALFTRSLDRDPKNLTIISALADTLANLGRTREALAWIDRALAFSPGDPAITSQKGQILLSEGDLDAAGRVLDPLPANADDVDATQTRVSYLLFRRDYPGVIRLMQDVMKAPGFAVNGWTGNYYAALGWAQRLSGDGAAARATFAEGRRRIAALDAGTNDNGYLASQLSTLDAGLGNADAAEREAKRAVELAGNDRYMESGQKESLAETQALIGRKEQALATLEELARGPLPTPYGILKLSSAFDGLRSDPRFVKLLADSQARLRAQSKAP